MDLCGFFKFGFGRVEEKKKKNLKTNNFGTRYWAYRL